MDRLEAADLARKAERENPAPTPRCDSVTPLRDVLVNVLRGNGGHRGAGELAEDVLAVLTPDALGLEQVGWRSTETGTFFHDHRDWTDDEPVYRLTPNARTTEEGS